MHMAEGFECALQAGRHAWSKPTLCTVEREEAAALILGFACSLQAGRHACSKPTLYTEEREEAAALSLGACKRFRKSVAGSDFRLIELQLYLISILEC